MGAWCSKADATAAVNVSQRANPTGKNGDLLPRLDDGDDAPSSHAKGPYGSQHAVGENHKTIAEALEGYLIRLEASVDAPPHIPE